MTASVATISVAHAGTAYFWLDAYPNNSDADQAAVAAAGGISHANGSVEFKTINFDSRTSSTGYVVDGWLATGGVAYAGPGATSGMDNTLWDFTGVVT